MATLPNMKARGEATDLKILKPGVHKMTVKRVTERSGFQSGEAYWRVLFESVDEPGGFAVRNFSFADDAWPYTEKLFHALGFSDEELGETMEPDSLFGLNGNFRIATRSQDGRRSNRIVEPVLDTEEEREEQAVAVASAIGPDKDD